MSKHDVCAVGTAKRKLWEAHSKRTAVVRGNDNWGAVRSHICDYVVTFYQHASAPISEHRYDTTTTAESECSKVGVSRLCVYCIVYGVYTCKIRFSCSYSTHEFIG